MPLNDATPDIQVDPDTFTVRIDGVDHPMQGLADRPGWWTLPADDAAPQGTVRYGYILTKTFDEGTPKEREQISDVLPDPRSRRQPQGVHELSCTFDADAFEWHDADFRPRPLQDSVLYELHLGTFTAGPDGRGGAAGGPAAAELPRLHHRPGSCTDRPGRLLDQPHAGRLCPEPVAGAGLARRRVGRGTADGAGRGAQRA